MRIIAVVNQKGGCGKTTTVANLAGALAEQGSRVLVVDMDPQGHATLALGIDAETLDENLYEILVEPIGSPAAGRLAKIVKVHSELLHVAPSGIVLSALEQKLTADRAEGRTERLANALAMVADDYDYALIDCPPNVGVLTFNALRRFRSARQVGGGEGSCLHRARRWPADQHVAPPQGVWPEVERRQDPLDGERGRNCDALHERSA